MQKTHKKFSLKDLAGGEGRVKFIKSWKGKIISESEWFPNLLMKDAGYGVGNIVMAMTGDANTEVTHAKIGTGAGTIAETDHDLAAPATIGGVNPVILRGDKSIISNNIAHFEFFISDADLPNGTYTRWGIFTGTYAVDEKMMSHCAITPSYSKATNQDTTVVHEVAINN